MPHAGRCREFSTSRLDDETYKEYIQWKYEDLLDKTCPLGDVYLIALVKSERIQQKFLELSNKCLSEARTSEDDTAADLHLRVTEIISKQIDGEAQVEAEANTYRHIPQSVKTDGQATTRMKYEASCEEIEDEYEQTVLATSTLHARKKAKVAVEAKGKLNDLFQVVVTRMLRDRTTLVEELKREETWVLGRAQAYREEAFASHISGHNDAACMTNLFQAAAAAKDLLLPKTFWSSLDALLNSVPAFRLRFTPLSVGSIK